MSKDTRHIVLVFLALAAILIGALLVNGYPAEAHVQAFPHMHPHAESSSWEDLFFSLVWIGGGITAVVGGYWLGLRIERRDGK